MTYNLEVSGKKITFDFKNLAEQANGSVFVKLGETMVLATAVCSKQERDVDFFPLTVEFEEKYYAAGKILGSRYLRRESRPSEEAILTARLIDRAIRPRFPKNFFQEVQVITTCLSWDGENDPDIVGLLASSLALLISDIPWQGPIGAVRVGKINGQFILNPSYEEREKSEIDLVFAGIEEGKDILINMIEAETREAAEETVLEAWDFAKPEIKKIIDFQKEIAKKQGKEKMAFVEKTAEPELKNEVKQFLKNKLEKALYGKERKKELSSLKDELTAHFEQKYPENLKEIKNIFEQELEEILRKNILEKEKRPDGRKLNQLREIKCQTGIIPRAHGSGLFCRGKTKTLSILTLGAPGDVRFLEGMEFVGKKRFMHHYNFPPYCSGEIKPVRGPGRREIGHGMLAEKALSPIIPPFEEFPYTIRIVSEVLSSNGSTSMASVSSSSLALMDAGVPIKRPVTGIALGLITDKGSLENYKLLTDIQGPEDHYGDMDLKIAGTKKGITAIQMDVKIKGINKEILNKGLNQGRKTRLELLKIMEKTLPRPRGKLSPFAPQILTLQINPEKIRDVVGPGGKVINEIIANTGVSIDIEPSGLIYITSEKEETAKKALSWIKNITREVKPGEVFQGKVKRILGFGAIVEIFPGHEGLVHISQLAPYRVEKVEDVVKVGDIIPVKVINVDEQGRINLSLKDINQKPKIKNAKRSR